MAATTAATLATRIARVTPLRTRIRLLPEPSTMTTQSRTDPILSTCHKHPDHPSCQELTCAFVRKSPICPIRATDLAAVAEQ